MSADHPDIVLLRRLNGLDDISTTGTAVPPPPASPACSRPDPIGLPTALIMSVSAVVSVGVLYFVAMTVLQFLLGGAR